MFYVVISFHSLLHEWRNLVDTKNTAYGRSVGHLCRNKDDLPHFKSICELFKLDFMFKLTQVI